MMVIFWDKSGILLSEYLPGGTTISSLYYTSIIERLRYCVIVEKRRGKAVLLLHVNALVVQAAIGKCALLEVNDSAYSPDIARSDYFLFQASQCSEKSHGKRPCRIKFIARILINAAIHVCSET